MSGVSVFARVRPPIGREISLENAIWTSGSRIECFDGSGNTYSTTLDGVLDSNATQGDFAWTVNGSILELTQII